MQRTPFRSILISIAAFCSVSRAGLIEATFTGVVDGISENVQMPFAIDDAFRLTYTIDSEAPNVGEAYSRLYQTNESLVAIGSTQNYPALDSMIDVRTFINSRPAVFIWNQYYSTGEQQTPWGLVILLEGATGTTLDDDSLPTNIQLAEYEIATWYLYGFSALMTPEWERSVVDGTITGIEMTPVPEPASLLLCAVGALALTRRKPRANARV